MTTIIKCRWCGSMDGSCRDNKRPFCEDCLSQCKRECRTCHKPYPSIEKHFPCETSVRCNSCSVRYEKAREKRTQKGGGLLPNETNSICRWTKADLLSIKKKPQLTMTQEMMNPKKNRQLSITDEEEEEDDDVDDDTGSDAQTDNDEGSLKRKIENSNVKPITQSRNRKKQKLKNDEQIKQTERQVSDILNKNESPIKKPTTTPRPKRKKTEITAHQKINRNLINQLVAFTEMSPDKCTLTIKL